MLSHTDSDADLLVSTEEGVEVSVETAAAIERGINAADEGRVVCGRAVREKIVSRPTQPPVSSR